MKSFSVIKVLLKTFARETKRGLIEYAAEMRVADTEEGKRGVAKVAATDVFRRFDGVVNRIGMIGALEAVEKNVSGAKEEILRATRSGERVSRPLLKFYLNGVLTAAALVEAVLSLSDEDGAVPHEVGSPATLEEYRRSKVVKGYGSGKGVTRAPVSLAAATRITTEAEKEMVERSAHNIKNHVDDIDSMTDEEFTGIIMLSLIHISEPTRPCH
jgi:hypothetical protein